MQRMSHVTVKPVSKQGAPANAVLRGSGISNQGLLVRVLQEQPGDPRDDLQSRRRSERGTQVQGGR